MSKGGEERLQRQETRCLGEVHRLVERKDPVVKRGPAQDTRHSRHDDVWPTLVHPSGSPPPKLTQRPGGKRRGPRQHGGHLIGSLTLRAARTAGPTSTGPA